MRLLRTLAWCLGGLAALLLLLGVAVRLLVNPNDYKDRITSAVKTSTGRDLTLAGDIKLSVFPWVALELGPARLGNPAGFQTTDFLSVEHVALRIKLLPLLHKSLQIGRVEIDQMNLNLRKNSAGKGNWEEFGNASATPPGSIPSAGAPGSSIFQSLAGITISNSRVTYGALSIADLKLLVGQVSQKASVPVSLSFKLDRGPAAAAASVAATLKISLDMAASQYGLQDLDLTGALNSRSGAPALPFEFASASMTVDLAAQTLRAPRMAARLAAAKVSGSLSGDQIMDRPALTGSLVMEPVDLRALMMQLGIEPPRTRDVKAFSRLGFKTDFRYANNAVQLQNFAGQLDDSRLQGSISLTDLDTKATAFELTLDHIDIDRYRAPPAPTAASPSGAKPSPLPTTTMKALDVHGTFVTGSAKFSGLTLADLSVNLQAHNGLLRLFPLKAALYGGRYSGDISYDVRGATPQVQLNQQLTGIDMTPLLKDALNSQRLSGHGNASFTLAGHGLDSDAMTRSLSGRLELNLADGAIEGADLGYEIGLAQALLKRQPLPATANTHRTKFEALKMSADIADGVAKTTDLTVATAYLRVTGQGTTNLASKAIDLHLLATVLKASSDPQGTDLSQLTLAEIPVSVTGTADQPRVRPDLQGLLKSQLQQKAKDLIKDKLNDRLKGIFGTH